MSKLDRRGLVADLKKIGMGRKKARKAIQAMVDSWSKALARKEPVEIPTGWLIVREIRVRRVYRLGHIVDIPKRNRRFRIRRVSRTKLKDWRYVKSKG